MNILKLNKDMKNFYLFAIGQFISQFGSKMTSYGLILWAYKQSGSVLSTSFLMICYVVPEVLFNFIAGSISDGWNKKKIMLISDSIAAMFSLSVIITLMTDSMRIDYLYIINFMLGITDAFQTPASDVTISIIVPKYKYIDASGFRSFCDAFTGIFYPIVTTSVYAFFGLKVVVIIDICTFIYAFFTLAIRVKIPKVDRYTHNQQLNIFEQCKLGIKYLVGKKDIFSLIIFMAFINLIAAIYNSNLAPMILSRNGNNRIQLGIVSSAIGVAGLVGSILVTKVRQTNKRITLILNIMTFSFLVCNTLLGVGRNYYVWTFAVLIGNVLIPFLTANVSYIMRTNVPIELQGRVFSARNTLQYISIPIGYLIGGFASDKIFEPFMKHPSSLQSFFTILVGSGKGSGIALVYVLIGILGVLGCSVFRLNKDLRSLDE